MSLFDILCDLFGLNNVLRNNNDELKLIIDMISLFLKMGEHIAVNQVNPYAYKMQCNGNK
jgi:hypothetical protein